MTDDSPTTHKDTSSDSGNELAMTDRSLWRGWLREVTLRVPDPDEAALYYATLLGGVAQGRAVELGSSTRLVLELGSPALLSATFDLTTPAHGAQPRSEQTLSTLTDPDGRVFHVRYVPSIEERLTTTVTRLGHLTFETPDPPRAQAFFEQYGFQLSEGLGPNFRWLRCNPLHHTLAFSRGPAAALHHIGIEVRDRVALIDICDRLASMDQLVQYGPGRHLVGGNLFLYLLDRYGIRFEFFCELQRIPVRDWQPNLHEVVDRRKSINIWGPQPPEDYWKGLS